MTADIPDNPKAQYLFLGFSAYQNSSVLFFCGHVHIISRRNYTLVMKIVQLWYSSPENLHLNFVVYMHGQN